MANSIVVRLSCTLGVASASRDGDECDVGALVEIVAPRQRQAPGKVG